MEASPTATTSSKQAKIALDASSEASNAAKYREYERDYVRWIHHKYFSSQVLGANDPVYESTMPIEGFVIRATKNPPLKSFAESKASLESSATGAGGGGGGGGGGESPAQASARKKQTRR